MFAKSHLLKSNHATAYRVSMLASSCPADENRLQRSMIQSQPIFDPGCLESAGPAKGMNRQPRQGGSLSR